MPKVFLSYSRKDQAFVEELYRRLTRDGVECFFDKESIEWGANFVLALENAIADCEFIVLILSPDFVTSEWSQIERTGAMAKNPDSLRPLMRRHCDLPAFLKTPNYIDVTTDARFNKQYPKICRSLGGSPKKTPKPLKRGQLPPEQQLPPGSRMSLRSMGNRFVGRVDALWDLHDLLFNKDIAIVSGIGVIAGTGGLGKTQLAIEYVRRFGYLYEGGVWWVEADQGLGAMIALLSEATSLKVDGALPEPQQTAQLWDSLRDRGASLLVLDNFPEEGSLGPYLPASSNVQALVTTRRGDLNQPKLALRFLEPGAALDLLNSGDRKFGPEAGPLLEALGGLPLAIELTRGFLNLRKDLDPQRLLAEMSKAGEIETLRAFARRYGDELPSQHERDVAATFQLSWDLLGDAATRTLRAIAEMAPVPVPVRLLRSTLGLNETGIHDSLSESISELERLSLAERDEQNNPAIHRLVRSFVHHITPANESLRKSVAEALSSEMARVQDLADTQAYAELEPVLPHAEILAQADGVEPQTKVDLWGDIGWQHEDHGRYVAGKVARAHSLREAEASFEPGHPTIARSQSNLATVLRDLGELEEARDLMRHALASNEASFESGHTSIASSQSNLALVLQDLGQLAEARDLLRQALASNKASFEPGHPSIASSQSNLALVLKDLGQLEEARDLMRHALASNEASFESGHTSIASSQSNLAAVLKNLGELEEARDLSRHALASNKASFEPGHPTIAIGQSNLALVLKDLGELEEARNLSRQALASNKASFEPGHPSIAIKQSVLATVLKDFDELEEARDLLRQAHRSFQDKLGPSHPTTKKMLGLLRAVGGDSAGR